MPAEIGQADRPGLADHQSEDAVTSRWRAYASALFLVDAEGRKALEQPAIWREHADGGELRSDELGGRLNRMVEDGFERHIRDQAGGGDNQALEAFLSAGVTRGGSWIHQGNVHAQPLPGNPLIASRQLHQVFTWLTLL